MRRPCLLRRLDVKAVRVVVTRPEPGLTRTAGRLRGMGIEPVLLPLFETRVLDDGVVRAGAAKADALVVTSAAAIRAAEEAVDRFMPLWAVGRATAETARQAGFTIVHEGNGDGAGLAELIVAAHRAAPRRWLYLAGRVRTATFERDLAEAETPIEVVEVYDARALKHAEQVLVARLRHPAPEAVLLYSPRAATEWRSTVARASLEAEAAAIVPVCMSENVAAELDPETRQIALVAPAPDEDALLAVLARFRNHGR